MAYENGPACARNGRDFVGPRESQRALKYEISMSRRGARHVMRAAGEVNAPSLLFLFGGAELASRCATVSSWRAGEKAAAALNAYLSKMAAPMAKASRGHHHRRRADGVKIGRSPPPLAAVCADVRGAACASWVAAEAGGMALKWHELRNLFHGVINRA